jgi:hypothetical protein
MADDILSLYHVLYYKPVWWALGSHPDPDAAADNDLSDGQPGYVISGPPPEPIKS